MCLHKDTYIGTYYDSLNKYQQEKMGLFEYVKDSNQGVFLEIGVAGYNQIDYLIKNFSFARKTIYYFCDLSEQVLSTFMEKNPALIEYIPINDIAKRYDGLTIKTLRANATTLPFHNNVVKGINLSAVCHEIFSYCGEKSLEKSFQEFLRVLEPNGVLVYRDPEQLNERDEYGTLVCNSIYLRLFLLSFLPVFLSCGNQKKLFSVRPSLYSQEEILVKYSDLQDDQEKNVTLTEFSRISFEDIDLEKKIIMTCKLGLINEIKRHFLLFYRNIFPIIFTKCRVDGKKVFMDGANELPNFDLKKRLGDMGITLGNKSMSYEHFIVLQKNCEYFQENLKQFITEKRINKNRNQKKNIQEKEMFEEIEGWLDREGSEYYYYMSPDELLTNVLKWSLDNGCIVDKNVYVLFPLGEEKNISIKRDLYSSIFAEHADVYDKVGKSMPINESKRIVHFQKMTIEKAFLIAQKIVNQSPKDYPKLSQFINTEIVKKLYEQYIKNEKKTFVNSNFIG